MSTTTIERRSPVTFNMVPEKVEWRDHWPVAQRYPHEGKGPWLVDLSHCEKWDFQSGSLDKLTPWDLPIPPQPGTCALTGGMLVNRLNATQAVVWHLSGGAPFALQVNEATDVTDASLLVGLVGPHLQAIMEKMTGLDLYRPGMTLPALIQGPVAHVPCRIARLQGKKTKDEGLLISCSTGYARDMIAALLHAGAEYGLQPAGERVWSAWIDRNTDKEKEAD